MKQVMGIINLNEKYNLNGLTRHRPLAAVPYGGRYRIIDFILSNMVNSGISNIGILIQNKYRSLFDHLRSGKEWDLDRKRDGLFIFPPDSIQQPLDYYKGDLQNFYNNLDYLHKSPQKFVVIAGSNIICNLNFNAAFEFHNKMKADVTMIYHQGLLNHNCKFSQCTMVQTADDGRVIDIKVDPVKAIDNKVSMEMYILEKSLLIDLIDACVSRGYYDLVKDCFIKNISMLNIYGYEYKGYLAQINNVEGYYRHSMSLLEPKIWQELFFNPGLIYTKVKDEAPAKYTESSEVKNSLIANGCIIEGKVENSIIFRGVKVNKGSYIKDSIIMQAGIIEDNVSLENVITDKEVRITKNVNLKGEKKYPLIIEKKITI